MGIIATLLGKESARFAPSPRPPGNTFLAFDSTMITPGETAAKVLAEQPLRISEQYGMFRAVTPSWGFWRDEDMSIPEPLREPDEQKCRQLARQYAAWGVQLLSPDVEMEWTSAPDPTTLLPFSPDQVVAFRKFCQRWTRVIKWMRAEVPGMLFDLFGCPPFGTWYLNDSPAIRAERTRRDQMAIDEGLIDVCSVICPEMYIDHPVPENPSLTWDVRQQNWEDSLQAICEECRTMFHRPVVPFIMAHPNNAATQDVSDLMPAEIWARQTATCRRVADGWDLWGWCSVFDSAPHVAAIRAALN